MSMTEADRLDAVIQSARHNRERFEWFCRQLTAEELVRPIPESHWQVRDYIAHLASIDTWVNDWFGAMAAGERYIPRNDDGSTFDIDSWNDARVEERKDRTVEQLLEEAATHRSRLEETIRRFDSDTLATRFTFRDNKVTLIEYLEQWTLHDPAHALDMLKALPERKQDPEVRAWIDEFKQQSLELVGDARSRGG